MYQAKSRRIQRVLLRALAIGLPIALLAAIAGAAKIALPLAALIAIVCGAGWWITRGHIEEFEQQLRKVG